MASLPPFVYHGHPQFGGNELPSSHCEFLVKLTHLYVVQDSRDHGVDDASAPEEGLNAMRPFCIYDGPWKYINYLKKTGVVGFIPQFSDVDLISNDLQVPSRGPSSPSFLVVGEEFVFDSDNFSNGFLVKNLSRFVQKEPGISEREETKDWKMITTRRHDLIMNRAGRWYYMGVYKSFCSAKIETYDFDILSKNVRLIFL